MANFTAFRFRPKDSTEDYVTVSTDTKLQGSHILPTHTLRMLGLISENEILHQDSAIPASEPGLNEWTYSYRVRVMERD